MPSDAEPPDVVVLPDRVERYGLVVRLIDRWTQEWAAGGDLSVGIWRDGHLLGSSGLHRRLGPGGLEIGCWVDHEHLGQGVATAASRALTDLAFSVPDIERVRICHDVSNPASGRVPAELGFHRLADRAAISPPAPASSGVEAVWQVTRGEWLALSDRRDDER